MADQCKPSGPLSAAERDALPSSAFGLPGKRAYPIPNLSHARNAKARASQMYNAGRLTARERDKINRRADAVIESCDANGDPPASGGRLWAYVGLGAGVLAIGGFAAWWFFFRTPKPGTKTPGAPGEAPASPPAPPDGYETTSCEIYRGRTLCVVAELEAGLGGLMGKYHWRVGEGTPSETGYLAPALAAKAGREYIDTLEDSPLPPGPIVEPDEPEAGAEPDQPAVAGLATGTSAAGVTLSTVDGQCVGITLNDLAQWVPYAKELLEGLNLEAWSSQELMDRIWKETFPQCGDHVSEIPGFTINGEPYADIVAAGQTFLDEEVVAYQFPHTPESVFAGFMVGEAWTPVFEEPVLQINPGPDNPLLEQYAKPGTADTYWIVTTVKPVMLSGGNPSQESTWRVWGPNTNVVGDPVAQGQTGSRPASLDEAKSWIDGVGS